MANRLHIFQTEHSEQFCELILVQGVLKSKTRWVMSLKWIVCLTYLLIGHFVDMAMHEEIFLDSAVTSYIIKFKKMASKIKYN